MTLTLDGCLALQLAAALGNPAIQACDALPHALSLVLDFVPAVESASITEHASSTARPKTLASTDPIAAEVDGLQYRTGEGPCLAALTDDAVVVSDFTDEPRWPTFAFRAMVETPLRAAMVLPLSSAGNPGFSLNLYSACSSACSRPDLSRATAAGAGIGLVLTALRERQRATNLDIALSTSRRIGASMGVLMNRFHWTEAEAFDALRHASQVTHRKLRDIADEVVLTGALPPA